MGTIRIRFSTQKTVTGVTDANNIPDSVFCNITNRGINQNNVIENTSANDKGLFSILNDLLQDTFTFDTNGRLLVSDTTAENTLAAIWGLLRDHFISGVEVPLQQIDDIYWVLNSIYLGIGYSGINTDTLKYQIGQIYVELREIERHLSLQNQGEATQASEMENNAAAVESKMDAVNNYSQPNVNYMLDQADVIWVSGASGQNLLATITNKPYYVMILLGVVSLGFVGYLLYGKGV